MSNIIFVNGQALPSLAQTQYLGAVEEMRELVNAGNDPRDIEIYWHDDKGLYHDIMYHDGKYIHRHEVVTMKECQILI